MKYNIGKSLFIAILFILVSCSADSTFQMLRNRHIVYEGQIQNYSVGPNYYSTQDVVMELWYSEPTFIYGYWQKKGSKQKHYLKGRITTLETMYGYFEGRRKIKSERIDYTYEHPDWRFKEMSKRNRWCRILLYEYQDEHFENFGDNCFYVYNFEGGKLQGSYYSHTYTFRTIGKDTYDTEFSTKFSVKDPNANVF